MRRKNNHFIQQLEARREAAKAKSQPKQSGEATGEEGHATDTGGIRPRFLFVSQKRRRPWK